MSTFTILPSYDHGASDRPLLGETIGENFNRIAATHADREALVDRPTGQRWTYAQLHRDVLALAHGLLRLGVDKGDRVGIWAPNCPEWTILQYATAGIGAILVPINPAYRTDGYINITGRLKDMIIRGGENVSPREIEEYLHTHPDIQDVQVIGVPDARLGEEIMAWVRLRPGAPPITAAGVRAYATGKLAHYKIPRYVRIVEDFPMTASGKVRKADMRKAAIDMLGLTDIATSVYA